MRFKDRHDAGQCLAKLLQAYQGLENTLIVGLPRGGIPIATSLSQQLQLPWSMLLVRKLGCPTNPELAFGAITEDGVCHFNKAIMRYAGISDDIVKQVTQHELQEIQRRKKHYRLPNTDFSHKTLILTDDGVATGATIRAAITHLRQYPLKKLVIATPVVAQPTYQVLASIVDDMVAVTIPDDLSAVGEYYQDFTQLTDADMQAFIVSGTFDTP